MEFGLSQEQILLQDSVNKFLTDKAPLSEVREIASGESGDADIWRGLAELGITGLLIPEAHGGVGLGCLDAINLDGGAASSFYTKNFSLTELSFVGSFFCVK